MANKTERSAPSITLPKGGGALRAIDEKFSVNAVNGSCELSIPLPFSKTRSGFDSGLTLRYSSASGNGVFGLGWSLTLPSIRRRTDRRLPRYEDALESDVFLYSGADDLVPTPDVTDNGTYRVVRYRPRIEGLFARIEKITRAGEGASYWKVTSRDNVTTIFGRTAAARIADPEDASRVAAWLPEWSYDDKGNCFELVYKDEDLSGAPNSVEEKNRHAGLPPFANKHLKNVRYGNRTPYLPSPAIPFDPPHPVNPRYFFETVFDYGEHDPLAPAPAEVTTWPCRFDPFSDFRAGFEQRTYRLCRRILFFHVFKELDGGAEPPAPVLVRSLDFGYQHFHFDGAPHHSEEAELLVSARTVFHRGAVTKAMPAVELTYQSPDWNQTVETLDGTTLAAGYQWLDLFGDGAPGILAESASAWYFKRNEGGGKFAAPRAVAPKPSFAGVANGAVQFQDLDANGSKQLVSLREEPRGYFALDDDDQWQSFRAFAQIAPEIDDPNARFIDLDGDGKPDLLVGEDLVFRWYPSLGTEGFDGPRLTSPPLDDERGPAIVFAEEQQSIFIADMNGDGLADLVRVRDGNVSYWPNRGYGRFGARVTMRNAPRFGDAFDARKVQLADISGTGATDLLWLGDGGFRAFTNLAGNAWSDAQPIDPFPGTEPPNRISVLDILGNGTVSLVWSSPLPQHASSPIRYVDLMGGRKPYVLTSFRNNLGKEVRIEYRSSTQFALRDRAEGHPWATKLPFPVMCVTRTETRDSVSGCRFAQEYRYRHGYYDHDEREFRGFGMVEQIDTETFDKFRLTGASNVVDAALHQAPVRTRTWYHTGAFERGARIQELFAKDYFAGPFEEQLPDAFIAPLPSTPDEMREAARACKGMMLLQEIYADDGAPNASLPYSTTTRNCVLRMLQPRLANRNAVFLAAQSETITRHYERTANDPRIAHEIATVLDETGSVVESASIVYPRAIADATAPVEVQQAQARSSITYTVHAYTNDAIGAAAHRLRQRSESRVYELTGAVPAGARFTRTEIRAQFAGASPRAFEAPPTSGLVQRRLIQHTRTLFASNADPSIALPLHQQHSLGLTFESYTLALTPSLRTALYGTRVDDAMLAAARYLQDLDGWWIPSGTVRYPANPEQHFYLPDRYVDPYGNTTNVRYFADYHLMIDRVEDATLATTTVLDFDFHALQPRSVRDINDNITDVAFDAAGLVVGLAMRGKGAEADDLSGFTADLTPAQINAFFADPAANGAALLQHATSRFVYRLDSVPVAAGVIERETHHQDALASGTPSRLRYAFEYSNGLGGVAMKKAQAEPGLAKSAQVAGDGTATITDVDTTPNLRWIGNGRTVVNNKGKQVLQYEPFFSVTHAYETAQELVASGVTAITHHDPLGRVVRTDSPDGSFSRIETSAWSERVFDVNDTVLASDWHAARIGGALGIHEQRAAQKTEVHANTPGLTHFDPLGRAIATDAHNRFFDRITLAERNEHYVTRSVLDIDGKTLAVIDARGNTVMTHAHDLAGRPCHNVSMDGGARRLFSDVLGKQRFGWDAKGNRFETRYDVLHRPIETIVITAAATTFVSEKTVYGADKTRNQNGQVIAQFDDSGVIETDRYDFKGNAVESQRRFTAAATGDIDWTTPAALLGAHLTRASFDALGRVISGTTPDGSITTLRYSESGNVTAIDASVRGAASRPFLVRVTHDAKGQRQQIDYGNGVTTRFTYDRETFHVRRIHTAPALGGAALQDLQYVYDPAGNITSIRDLAQQTLYFNNQIVEPHNDYVYDAAYRLIEANGREHIALNVPSSRFDAERMNLAHRADGNAMQRYREQYDYDAAGNLTAIVHASGSGPFTHRWTRTLTPQASNNQLLSSAVGASTETFTYDAHGNLTGFTGFAPLDWDTHDRLRSADLGGGGSARYTYDTGAGRARKIVRRPGGIVEERLYLGAVEIFTRTQNGTLDLRRETLHLFDGAHRMAMVDTRTDGAGSGPAQLIRFQFSNHLDSASLELDDAASIISYEECSPFGSTTLQTIDATREVPARRYRYTGKERDEETGFNYHGARYYAPWLGRWISRDPAGLADGLNVYSYVRNRPTALADPTGTQGDDPFRLRVAPPWTYSVGPVQFTDIQLAPPPRFQLRLQFHDLFSSNRSVSLQPGYQGLSGGVRSPVQVEGTSMLGGFASGQFNLGLRYSPGGLLVAGAEARGSFSLGPFDARGSASFYGSTILPERIYLSRWQEQLTGAARDARGELWANVSVGFAGQPLGYFSLHANAAQGQGTYTGRLLLGLPSGQGQPATPIASVRTQGTFSYDIDRFSLAGTFSVLSPVALGGGAYSYDLNRGFQLQAGYFGLLAGPTGLGVDIQPFTDADRARPRVGPAGRGIVDVFEPGTGIGGSYISITQSRRLVFSVGLAPRSTVEHYSLDQPHPEGFVGSLPGVKEALGALYGRPLSTDAGVFVGGTLKIWF